MAFLWNFWWMRHNLAAGAGAALFNSDALFAPFGIDLVLHTHTALPALAGATVAGWLPLVAAHNLILLACLALNGLAAYLLCFDRTQHRPAALVGGLVFAGSPYIAAHLMGHFNLVAAWGVPLFVLFFLRALQADRRSWWLSSAAAGAALVSVAYTDYYYLVYCSVLAVWFLLWTLRPLRVTWQTRTLPSAVFRTVLLLLALDAVLVAVILITGGFSTAIGPVAISARRATNPLAAGWVLAAVAIFIKFRPQHVAVSLNRELLGKQLRRLAPCLGVVIAGLLPLILSAGRLWSAGDYSAPPPSWRSGPGGIDVATMVLGNPLHPLWGRLAQRAYAALALNRIESVGWLGLVPMAAVVLGVRRLRRDREFLLWLVTGAVFLVWALGPWLRIGGFDTGLMLPQNLFSYIPILSNARIPGRAMVVVFLALAVMTALVISRGTFNRPRLAAAALLAAVAVDFAPAPYPLTRIEVADLYSMIPPAGEGSVCELPTGIRDGLTMSGRFDEQVLINQTVHGRPIVGGFAARVPPSIRERYAVMPVVRSLIDLSGGGTVNVEDSRLTPGETEAALRAAGIEFVVLNRTASPARLTAYVEEKLPLTLVGKEEDRELYRIGVSGP